MGNAAFHLAIFARDLDPIIFMRVLRVVFFFLAAALMLGEPMNCGGRNQTFHRVVAVLFFTGSWISWTQAHTRMALVIKDPVHFFDIVPASDLFWSELAFTSAIVAVAMRLLYDTYVSYRLSHLGCASDCGRECDPTLQK